MLPACWSRPNRRLPWPKRYVGCSVIPKRAMRLAQAARAVLETEFNCRETTKHLRDLMYGRCCADERHPILAEEVGLPSALAAHPAAE